MTAAEWDKVFQRQQWGRWPDTRFVEWCMRTFGAAGERERETIRFLELGCGAGAQLGFLQNEGFQAYGVDGSRAALNQAKRNLREFDGVRPVLWEADLINFEVPATAITQEGAFMVGPAAATAPVSDSFQRLDMGGFDCIVDVCTLQHMPPGDYSIIRRAHRWLRPGGWIFSKWAAHRHDRPAPPRAEGAIPAPLLMSYHDIQHVFPGFDLTVDEEVVTTFGPPAEERRHWIITGRKV